MNTELPNLIVDVFSLVDTETAIVGASSSSGKVRRRGGEGCLQVRRVDSLISFQDGGEKKDDRERFRGLLREAEKFLPEGTLKERLEIDTLGEVGVLKQPKKFFNTIIKLKTKLL